MEKAARLVDRALIRVSGPDARPFLQGLITQEIATAKGPVFAALLTPQGKIAFDFLIAPIAGDLILDTDAAGAEALLKRLALYRLRADVAFERLGGWAVAAIVSNRSIEVAGEGAVFADPRLAALGRRMMAPAAALDAIAPAGEMALDYAAHRVLLGVPELGADFGPEEMFLLDVNYDALNGVSYRKGCFVGQEVTSRMKRKGEVRRRTAIARFKGAPLAKGAIASAGGAEIGVIMSGAAGVALASVRLDRLAAAEAAGEPITADGRPLRLEIPAYLERG